MKKISLLFLIIYSTIIFAQAPEIEWAKCYGGSSYDIARSIQQTSDGGYIVAGNTMSNDGDVSEYFGTEYGDWFGYEGDFWVVKLDQNGDIVWEKTFGSSKLEVAESISITSDEGYVVCGTKARENSPVIKDGWVIKLDSSGNLEWEKVLQIAESSDFAYSIEQTQDDGYIVVGSTITNNRWMVKLNEDGEVLWQNTYDGITDSDSKFNVIQTSDGGFILGGATLIDNNYSAIISKTDSQGNLEWETAKSISNSSEYYTVSIKPTSFDNGYIAGLKVTTSTGNFNSILIKLDNSGNILWERSITEISGEVLQDVVVTPNNDYVLITNAQCNPYEGSESKYYIVKLNQEGHFLWEKCIGGSSNDLRSSKPYEAQITLDEGLIIAGYSSSNSGDVNGWHEGYSNNNATTDFWIVKLSSDQMSTLENDFSNISIYPNPVKKILYFSEKLYGIEIYTLDGKKVIQSIESSNLNLSSIPSGTYLLEAKNSNGIKIQSKFIKN